MFGTLFDEESIDHSLTTTHPTKGRDSIGVDSPEADPPPTGRASNYSLCGLNNQGTTCYLNSLIQTLFFTPELRDAIFKLTPEELGFKGDASNKKVRVIMVELQRLFARMLRLDAAIVSTTSLTESFGWVEREAFQQHDAQELMRILFDAIQSSLVGTSCSTLIQDLYGGSTVDKITCKSCGNISEKTGIFLDLNITVTGYSSLESSLQSSFVEKEMMEGANQYLCNKCDRHVDASKETKIRSLPPILVLSLLRLGYDTIKKQRYKETSRFEFPMEINMNPFCEKVLALEDSEYELFASVIHSGSSYCGHYNVHIQDVDHIGIWQSPANNCVILKPEVTTEVKSIPVQDYKPLDLLILILEKSGSNGISFDLLSTEVNKQINCGWNKKYKKKYGSLKKFIAKYSEVFYFSEKTNIVRLKKLNSSNDFISETAVNGLSHLEIISKCEDIIERDDDQSCQNCESVSQPCVNGLTDTKNWFDINDSKVTPILLEDVQMQFGGRVCAYMLFYRKKSLRRHLTEELNVPDHLFEMIHEENEELKKKREEYEKSINLVLLIIHFGKNHFISNGILQADENELSVTEMIFDRRCSVLQLYQNILNEFSQLTGKAFSMYRCKELPSGLHLYEDFVKEHKNNTIQEVGLVNGSRIFIWNGNMMNGLTLSFGSEHEPVLLHVKVEKEDGSVVNTDFAFPKNTTLSAILLVIAEQMKLKACDLAVTKIYHGQSIQLVNASHEENTLLELELNNFDSLHFEVSKTNVNSCTHKIAKQASTVLVKVENRCQELHDSVENWPVIEVEVNKSALLSELKAISLSKLSLNNQKHYRLRVQELEFNLPVYEDKRVEDLGYALRTPLILEEGLPLSQNQLVVTYNGNFGSGDSCSEVTVNCDITVRECLQTILNSAGVNGGEWYLQRRNYFGEPTSVLSKADATLLSEGVQHGDHLIVRQGHIVPYGYYSFNIELYPSLLAKTQAPGKHWMWVMEKMARFQNYEQKSNNFTKAMSISLGEVEISAEASLENLKQQILTLPLLEELELYCQPQCIRLRLINNGRPGHILRDHQNTLKKLKMSNQSRLCVQILSSEEDLSPDTLMVEVVQKVKNTNTYTDPVEVSWETKTGTLNCLRHAIANQLFLNESCLRLAKYLPDEFNWKVLTNDTQIPNNYKSFKRKNKNRADLRHEPYRIQDGDTIAIQDVNEESNKDFSSDDDIINRQRLEQEKESKQKQIFLAQERTKPPEVGLKIKVGDFS